MQDVTASQHAQIRWPWAWLSLGITLSIYLIVRPASPDLAAQVARASVAEVTGFSQWWLGWFGGLQGQTYSVLAPITMHLVSTVFAASAAVVISFIALADLLPGARRPTAGASAFAIMLVANVAAGRLTFALSFTLGVVCLALVRRHNRWAIAAALLCSLLSLLGAFFLGVAAFAVAVSDKRRRKLAIAVAALLLAVGVLAQLLFPNTGTMPYGIFDLLGATATAISVAIFVPVRPIRTGALVMAVLPLVIMIDPGAIGENVVRLSWLVAAPLLAAYGTAKRSWLVPLVAVGAAIWPLTNTTLQLTHSLDSSSRLAYYKPLQAELTHLQHLAGPGALGERVEVVPTRTHWESAYLIGTVQLARGWDRQADVGLNPLFYAPTLSSDTYRQWLQQLSVGWVALPNAPLDGAGIREAELVRSGPSYLTQVWSNAQWRLFRVAGAAPLVTGASVAAITPNAVTLRFDTAEVSQVQIRWSPYLVAQTVDGTRIACVEANGAFTTVIAPAPGSYVLHATPTSSTARQRATCEREQEADAGS